MKRLLLTTATLGLVGLVGLSSPAAAADFTYSPPGELEGSEPGRSDTHIYVPNMRFPIESAPAYANSQIYGHGGYMGPGGGQCDANNYSYPWWDNFCENRSWDVPMCPSGNGHQGQDIRPATCEASKWWCVAAESGTITNIGTYSVYLQSDNGTRHRYLHMNMARLQVSEGQHVSKGQRLGLVDNDFGGTATTIHLHYDLHQNVSGIGNTYVPTYMSLVDSYQRLLGVPAEPCEALGPDGGTLDNSGACFVLHGPPTSWRYVSDAGHGGDLHWTYAWNDPDPGNWAQWLVETSQSGRYQIEVNLVSAYAQSVQAKYRVRHGGQESDVRLDMTAASGWVSLGEFDFAQGADQWVAMYDNTGEELSQQRKLIADAIRLTRVDPPDPDPDTGSADTGSPDTGSADTGSSADTGGGTPDTGAGTVDTGSGTDTGSADDSGGGLDDDASGGGGAKMTSTSSCSTTGGAAPLGAWLVVALLGLFGRRRRA